MERIKQDHIIKWLEKTAESMASNKRYLSDLDSPIGDADHGINMNRGFAKVLKKVEEYNSKNIGAILKDTGMTLISSVGGAAGPLYGTFYLKTGQALADKTELSLEDLHNSLLNGLEGIKSRGRASLNEKTIIDAMEPAVDALKDSCDRGDTILNAIDNAVYAAEKGMKSTIDMIARKGRASYLGERSIGHQDPGATSTYLIFKALKEALI